MIIIGNPSCVRYAHPSKTLPRPFRDPSENCSLPPYPPELGRGRKAWKPSRRILRLIFPPGHNAQSVFLQGSFQQRLECARAIEARLRAEMCGKNWPLIHFRVIGQAQPINRDAALSGTVNSIVTLGLEQLIAPTTAALKRWLRRGSPHGHKGYCVRSSKAQNCLHPSRAVTVLL